MLTLRLDQCESNVLGKEGVRGDVICARIDGCNLSTAEDPV